MAQGRPHLCGLSRPFLRLTCGKARGQKTQKGLSKVPSLGCTNPHGDIGARHGDGPMKRPASLGRCWCGTWRLSEANGHGRSASVFLFIASQFDRAESFRAPAWPRPRGGGRDAAHAGFRSRSALGHHHQPRRPAARQLPRAGPFAAVRAARWRMLGPILCVENSVRSSSPSSPKFHRFVLRGRKREEKPGFDVGTVRWQAAAWPLETAPWARTSRRQPLEARQRGNHHTGRNIALSPVLATPTRN